MLAYMDVKADKVFILTNRDFRREKTEVMEDVTIKAQIYAFLAHFFQNIEVQEDQDIFALGFINSLFAMQLVLFLEKEFAITITDSDLDLDNFKTINAMVGLVQRKITRLEV